MSFAATESQTMLADMVGKLLTDCNPFEVRRHRLSGSQPDRLALWPALAEQGVLGAAFTEADGGFGGSMRDLAVVLNQVGHHLVVEPVLASAICGHVLSAAGETDMVAALIEGSLILAFAHVDRADVFASPITEATGGSNDYRLTGRKLAVRHADLAHGFVVTASLEAEAACFYVPADAPGVELDRLRLIDASSAATINLDNAPARLLGGEAVVSEALLWHLVGLAAETSGILDALNTRTFSYMAVRKQFGVPLATFQALQHRAADMFAAAEAARVLTTCAITAIDSGASVQSALASAAKALTDDAGRQIGHEAVQLHGGMGVSDELDISHYLRRLAAIRAELGAADLHRMRFANQAAPSGALLDEAPELAAFRLEVRYVVRNCLPADLAAKGRLDLEYQRSDFVRWQVILRERGWFAAAWSKDHGGAGWDLQKQLIFVQEAALSGAPPIIPYGVNMVGPVLTTFGSAEQQARHLPGILSSEVWWCQGYSEPNAGSDLASLKTTAIRDGDHYVVNGTKMWTTEAHWADWMHCLVRTDREAKPQRGISFLLIDMRTPGIEVRPIVTIDGQHHTNQLFFDAVRVPVENLVGAEGQGWSIAKFLLSNERVAIADTGPKLKLLSRIRTMFDAFKTTLYASDQAIALIEHKLADTTLQLASLCALEQAYVQMWSGGGSKEGPHASVLKIRGTEILQLLTEIALEIEGPLGAVHDPADLHAAPSASLGYSHTASVMAQQYLYGRCWSIFGGTNEVQRNIIARAILPR